MKRIEIFKTGTHRDMSGRVIEFGEKELKEIADAYDPVAAWKAPFVVGHPEHDSPAYGWTKGLAFENGTLFADPDQVDPAFAEGVKDGHWPNRSASFYLPDSPNNPKPGTFYLRHVGFLGAKPPAVKGLAPVEFAGSDEDTVELAVSFTEVENGVLRMLRSLRDFILSEHGQEKADQVIPAYELEYLGEVARDPEFGEGPTTIKEDIVSKKPKKNETQNGTVPDEVQARLDGLEAREAAFAERQRRSDAEGVVKAVIDGGQLTPAQADGLVNFMAGLDETTDTVSFGEGEAQVSPSAFMKAFLRRLPKQVNFGEEGQGIDPVDPSSEDLARGAVSYQEEMRGKGIMITTTDAVAHVAAGKHKE